MPLAGFDALYRAADATPEPVPVAVAGGADATVLEALATAQERGWITPLIAGPKEAIRAICGDQALDLGDASIADTEGAESARAAVSWVRSGAARMLMKGQIATPDLMHAMLDADGGLRTGCVIGQVVLMELPRDG